MPYITREDGEHFVIPSYRDVLAAKNKNALKKEVLQLSQSYGEYITMQRKGTLRYEVAFSPDTGYLLGESIWHHFKKPMDMIYCEAIPNTTEAILVIVKAGSVYLDGRFPLDTIPEELVIFLTQENNFAIFTYGDVPIVQSPEEGKFSFETSSIKSFTILETPVFPTLERLRIYQLQLVDPVLKANGIGVFPFKEIIIGIVIIGLGWMLWSYLTAEPEEVAPETPQVNPYQVYNDTLRSPPPDQEISAFLQTLQVFFTMPGWTMNDISYSSGGILVKVLSSGSKIETLNDWAKSNHATVGLMQDGFTVSMPVQRVSARPTPPNIYDLKAVISTVIDRIATVYPGNHVQLTEINNKGVYQEGKLIINIDKLTPSIIEIIGQQLKGLPLVLQGIKLTVQNGSFSGTIELLALGD